MSLFLGIKYNKTTKKKITKEKKWKKKGRKRIMMKIMMI